MNWIALLAALSGAIAVGAGAFGAGRICLDRQRAICRMRQQPFDRDRA